MRGPSLSRIAMLAVMPTEEEAREALALRLAHRCLDKAARIERLPLFDVAMEGVDALNLPRKTRKRRDLA